MRLNKPLTFPELVDELLNDINNLQLRTDGVEERVARLEDVKVQLQDKVVRLERAALRQTGQRVDISEPGKPPTAAAAAPRRRKR